MLTVSNLSLQFGKRVLFDEVNIMFTKGNCYGIIGANGAGKSTFLKILTGKQEPTTGNVSLEPGKRMSVLEQDHFAYDNFTVLETVLRGNKKLFEIKEEMDALYAKEDFSDADGIKAGELGVIYDEMGGWNAESDAQTMLSNVGIKDEMHWQLMGELENKDKVKVLLAQALFGNPDVLILDEPTTGLDPNQLMEIRTVIKNVGKDKTVFLSTHIMQEVEAICDRVIIINNGKIVADKKLDSLISEEKEQVIEVEFDYKVEEQLIAKIENLASYKNAHDMIWELTFKADKDMRPAVFDFANANGLKTLQLNQKNKNLEAVFREITK